jgi:hypothetical protein
MIKEQAANGKQRTSNQTNQLAGKIEVEELFLSTYFIGRATKAEPNS